MSTMSRRRSHEQTPTPSTYRATGCSSHRKTSSPSQSSGINRSEDPSTLDHDHQHLDGALRCMRMLLLFLLATVAFAHAAHATQPVQMCTTGTNSIAPDALLGCPKANVVFGIPKLGTELIRAQAPSQRWVAYSMLTANTLVYGGSPASWQLPAALGLPLIVGTTPVKPPVTPVCPATYSTGQWACTYTGSVATCTSLLIKDVTP